MRKFRVEIKVGAEWGTIANFATLEQAEKEIAHQQKMDAVQEEDNRYRIIEL